MPLSLRLIREIHGKLMEGVRGDSQTPGEFRRSQNWIGPAGCTLMDATFVPPPEAEMKECLDAFEKYLHRKSELPPLLRLALIHCQFEMIHPFLDGNGRIGRLLITLLLCVEGLLREPLLYLSAFFEKNREEYYGRLLAVSQRGAWEEWVVFFLKAVAAESRDAIERSGRILDLWRTYRSKMQEARGSSLVLELVDQFFAYPAITNRRAAEALSVTPRSAQLILEKLCDAGIVREATGHKRSRVYVAGELVRIMTA